MTTAKAMIDARPIANAIGATGHPDDVLADVAAWLTNQVMDTFPCVEESYSFHDACARIKDLLTLD